MDSVRTLSYKKMNIRKTGFNKKSRIFLISGKALFLIIFVIFMRSIQRQESTVANIPSSAEAQLKVVESGNPWHPSFGLDRIGGSSAAEDNEAGKGIPLVKRES
jgi:hypothetical protein